MRWRIGITFLIIICVLFAAMICAIDIKSVLQGEDEFKLPVGEDEIIWFIDDEKSYDAESSMQMWNGLMVSEKLYDILQKVDKSSYVAIVVQNNQESVMEEFVFKGKTYREYVKELEGLEAYLNKLEILLKEGEMLRYGELLYTEGVEDGIRWSKEYYDERVLFYGKELLQKFIVDKVFLREDLEKFMTETETEILRSKTILKDVVRAYVEYSARQIYSVFEAYGYCVTCKNDKLYLFIEKGKLADLKVEEADMYNFYLATKRGYESADVPKLDDTTEGECVKDEVIGFAFEKFHFDTLQDNFEEIKDDKDIIRILNETISVWQYTYDALVFTFYYEGNIEENIFESMNYVQLKKLDYPLRVVVVVKYEDIDVEILRELSQKEEVKSIHVSMPFNSAADED